MKNGVAECVASEVNDFSKEYIFFLLLGTELHKAQTALEVAENQAREYERHNVALQEEIAKLTSELQKSTKPIENSSEV